MTDRFGDKHAVQWQATQSLMEALRDGGMAVLASCGGQASCATCHVFVEGSLTAGIGTRTEDEIDILEDVEAFDPDTSRLSCQISFDEELDGLEVTIAPDDF